MCGTTHKTVKRVVERAEAGGPPQRAPRPRNFDQVRDLVAERVAKSAGRISAKRLLPVAKAAGYEGSARNLRRLVAEQKALWRKDNHRGRRPAVWSLGQYLVIDWAQAAPGLFVFCAVLAFSRWRFVRFAADQKAATTLSMIAEALAAIGGVPARVLADRITAAVEAALAGRKLTAAASVIELRRLGRAIMDTMLTGFAPSDLESVFETVADADGVIAVTPAFNASFSGLFKSFFDVLPEETLSEMPVLVAATGGTERHSLVLEHALRPMFSYLHAIVSPTGCTPPPTTSALNRVPSNSPKGSAKQPKISPAFCGLAVLAPAAMYSPRS